MSAGSGALGFGGGFAKGFANTLMENRKQKRQDEQLAEARKVKEWELKEPILRQHAMETNDWSIYQDSAVAMFPELGQHLKKNDSPFAFLGQRVGAKPGDTGVSGDPRPQLQAALSQTTTPPQTQGDQAQPQELPSQQAVQPTTPPDPKSMLFGRQMPTLEQRAEREGTIDSAKLRTQIAARRKIAEDLKLDPQDAVRYIATGQMAAEPTSKFAPMQLGAGVFNKETGEITEPASAKVTNETGALGERLREVLSRQKLSPGSATPEQLTQARSTAETELRTERARQQNLSQEATAALIAARGASVDTKQDRDDRRAKLVEAVLQNPLLYDDLTAGEKSEIGGELSSRGFNNFGKPLSDAAIAKITESKSALASLRDLRSVLQANEQYIGPITGLGALNPYSEARKAQADINLVKQRVGKALEGGVLRKEDEAKYKTILATLTDTPSTAIYKTDQMLEDLQRDLDLYQNEQRLAGRKVSSSAPPVKSGDTGTTMPVGSKKIGRFIVTSR